MSHPTLPYSEVLLVLQTAQAIALATADSAQIHLVISRSLHHYWQVLHIDVLVQFLLVVTLEDRELLYGARMHHWLRNRPQGGENARSIGDKGLMHRLRIVV